LYGHGHQRSNLPNDQGLQDGPSGIINGAPSLRTEAGYIRLQLRTEEAYLVFASPRRREIDAEPNHFGSRGIAGGG
jgi:hypothetical protein